MENSQFAVQCVQNTSKQRVQMTKYRCHFNLKSTSKVSQFEKKVVFSFLKMF